MKNKAKYVILFYIGFTTYITIETLFRGYSYPLMGVDGGICFLLFDKINEWIPWEVDLFWQGVIGSGIVTMSELVIGLLLPYFGIMPMWDYSEQWMNYRGVICPLFSLLWIGMSMIGIVMADCINYYFLQNGDRPKYRLFHIITMKFPVKE